MDWMPIRPGPVISARYMLWCPSIPVFSWTGFYAGMQAGYGFGHGSAVLRSPAGATFGPVLGLMVFAYVTARLLLFATAWAATSTDSLPAAPVETPEPIVITPRVPPADGLKARQIITAAVVGAVGALGLSRLSRRSRED